MTALLRLTDVAVARGGRTALSGVSLALDPGQALILRGPNGSGKTTLLRTIAALQPPLRGVISVAADQTAYAGHADGLKNALTAAENLSFWAHLFGGGGVAQALAAMDLADLAHRPAGTLSAGQKRRLGLARLLVTRRPIWLLDEPTVSLDAASVATFAAVVRMHLAQGGAVIAATHLDLGLPDSDVLDLTAYRHDPGPADSFGFDEAFA